MGKPLQDEHGFAAALETALALFEQNSRASGRTERMLARAQSGDQIVVPHDQMRRHIEARLKDMRKTGIKIITCMPVMAEVCRCIPTSERGETLFDHTFIYELIQTEMRSTFDRIGRVMRETTKSYPGHDLRRRPLPSPTYDPED